MDDGKFGFKKMSDKCRQEFDALFPPDPHTESQRSLLWVGWTAAWGLLDRQNKDSEHG